MNFAIYSHFQNNAWESKENRKKKTSLIKHRVLS